MVKKMKFLSLLKNMYCQQQPKTLSFRANNNHNDVVLKTTPESIPVATLSTSSDDDGDDQVETLIREFHDLRANRLFFEPENTKSLLSQPNSDSNSDENNSTSTFSSKILFKNSTAVSMDSENPYADFRKSMEEMVDAEGIKDRKGLDELLSCYLQVNEKSNHVYIVAAFVDLFGSSSHASTPNSSPLSFCSSSMPSSCSTPCGGAFRLEHIKEEVTRHDHHASSSKCPN